MGIKTSIYMLDVNLISQCNEFVRDMNEMSAHWHFKIVRFNETFAICTVNGFILEKDLFKEDDELVVEAVMAVHPQDNKEFFIYLLEGAESDSVVQKLESTYRSGFEAAGSVAAAVALREDRKLFFDANGQSLARGLGFL